MTGAAQNELNFKESHLNEGLRDALRAVLEPRALFALVFGSAVTPRFGPESDVDVAVFFGSRVGIDTVIDLKDELERATGREIDLVDLDTADLIISMQALFTGELLFSNPFSVYVLHKARTLSLYQDFKRSRAIIENSLLRGFPHARK